MGLITVSNLSRVWGGGQCPLIMILLDLDGWWIDPHLAGVVWVIYLKVENLYLMARNL